MPSKRKMFQYNIQTNCPFEHCMFEDCLCSLNIQLIYMFKNVQSVECTLVPKTGKLHQFNINLIENFCCYENKNSGDAYFYNKITFTRNID